MKHAWGLFCPRAVDGYFTDQQKVFGHDDFYERLLSQGFRRTKWQLVFPGQTAGIIKPISQEGMQYDELHVRFYDDGTISPELEYSRFSVKHWCGGRASGVQLLESMVNEFEMPGEEKDVLKQSFSFKSYEPTGQVGYLTAELLARGATNVFLGTWLLGLCFSGVVGINTLFSEDWFWGLEPLLGAAVGIPLVATALYETNVHTSEKESS